MNDDGPTFPEPKPRLKPVPEGGLSFDSEEERWAWWMFEELIGRGAILRIERAPTLELSPTVKLAGKNIFKDHKYTSDFKIIWDLGSPVTKLLTGEPSNTALTEPPVFWRTEDVSMIEVKPCFDAHNKTQLANINLKWVLQRYGILVQLIRTGQGERSFFSASWTPDKFKVTGTGKDRKLNYRIVRSLDELLESLKGLQPRP